MHWAKMAVRSGAGAVLLVLLAAGCATPAMKGTPFYTGEYEGRQGPAEDRVNAWPLLYYRDPALSVLWPLGEVTEDHVAVRPFYSVYGLHRADGKREYNVLWPLAQVDQVSGDKRVFPVFWDDDSLLVWPLYAHGPGRSMLFPLWIYSRRGDETRLHLVWPLGYYANGPRRHAWHFFPLAGDHARGDDQRYGFALWPLVHWWQDGGRTGSAVIPLYGYSAGPDGFLIGSPLYLQSRRGETQWRMVPPLWYDRQWPGGSLVLSPLYAQGRRGPASWHTVLPLYYYGHDAEGTALVTPLGGYRQGDITGWWALPILSGAYRRGNSGEFWFLAPLGRYAWSPGGNSHFFLPLYWHDDRQQLTVTPLWATWGPPERRRMAAPPLLSWYTRNADERRFYALLGLYGHAWNERSNRRDWLFPLWYWEADRAFYSPLVGWSTPLKDQSSRYFLTPLVGTMSGPTTGSWFAPLYAYGRREANDSWWLWYMLLGYHERSEHATTSFFLPLYWYERWGRPDAQHSRGWWAPPITWYRHVVTPPPKDPEALRKQVTPPPRETVSQGCFPLWYYYRETRLGQDHEQRDFSLLLWLYDYHRLTAATPQPPARARDYTRHRVLWRLYHYERADDAVSVDIVPGITYDKRPDGFRQTALLWRLFRHANGPEGRQLDLLFIPIWR